MKSRFFSICAALFLGLTGQAMALTIQPTLFQVDGYDAKTMSDVMVRSGLTEQSAIESSFLQTDEAFCINATNNKVCQFSVGGGLFVISNVQDTDAFIKVLRRAGAVSQSIGNGRRWDLRNLECSTRFDLQSRKLVTQCTFEQ